MDNINNNESSNVVPTRWNHESAKNFAKRLSDRRNELNLEQQDLADESKVKLRTIQNYESGKGSPSVKFIILLAGALHCDVGWLLTGEGPEPGPPGQKTAQSKPTSIYKVEDHPDRMAAPEREYDPHGGWKPRHEMQSEDYNIIGKVYDIIRSKSIYSAALKTNINAFHAAMISEKRHEETKNNLDNILNLLQNKDNIIEELKNNIEELKRDMKKHGAQIDALEEKADSEILIPAEKPTGSVGR